VYSSVGVKKKVPMSSIVKIKIN